MQIYAPMTNEASTGWSKLNYGEYFLFGKIKEDQKRSSGRMA
jgi:hypothetical protein